MNTTGHRVLITGGSKGIGLALAKQFHSAGNTVVLVGRDEAALAAAQRALPGAVVAVADITRADDRARLVAQFNDITILVNNAGVQVNGDLAQTALADIENELALNLVAPVLLTRAFLPLLQGRAQAAVVNVSSALAFVPKQSASVYCATKAALHSFTRSLRWQLEGSSVRVFDLIPPLVDTGMTSGRDSGKITPDELAREFWAGFQADRFEIAVGKAKALRLLSRWLPFLAERIVRRG